MIYVQRDCIWKTQIYTAQFKPKLKRYYWFFPKLGPRVKTSTHYGKSTMTCGELTVATMSNSLFPLLLNVLLTTYV